MKSLVILLTFLLTLNLTAQTYTNGVYVKDGKTVEVDKNVYSIITPSVVHFSNGVTTKIDTNTEFDINSFFQEVIDTNSIPHKSKFGSANFSSTLPQGSITVTYDGGNSNSSCVISTPLADFELSKGTFYFKVTDNKVLMVVLDGSLKVDWGKKNEEVITVENAAILSPNDIGILESKISFSTQKVSKEAIDKLNSDSKDLLYSKDSVMFATINGKTVGILIN